MVHRRAPGLKGVVHGVPDFRRRIRRVAGPSTRARQVREKGFTAEEHPPTMAGDRAECSRCRETFATPDELIVHSIEVHAGEPPAPSTDEPVAGAAGGGETPATGGGLDEETTA